MSPEIFVAFITASALLSLAPGPDNLFVLTQSALYGRHSGYFITLGLCTGLVVHTTAVALGVASIFMASSLAFTILKILGALYLLYLAIITWRANDARLDKAGSKPLSRAAAYRRGIIMNLTNPKVAVFFLAFLPQFADPDSGSMSWQLIQLGLIFIVVALLVFCLIASLSGVISTWLKNSNQAQHLMNRVAATVFVLLAARLVFSQR